MVSVEVKIQNKVNLATKRLLILTFRRDADLLIGRLVYLSMSGLLTNVVRIRIDSLRLTDVHRELEQPYDELDLKFILEAKSFFEKHRNDNDR